MATVSRKNKMDKNVTIMTVWNAKIYISADVYDPTTRSPSSSEVIWNFNQIWKPMMEFGRFVHCAENVPLYSTSSLLYHKCSLTCVWNAHTSFNRMDSNLFRMHWSYLILTMSNPKKYRQKKEKPDGLHQVVCSTIIKITVKKHCSRGPQS
ncbi:hypothetical protein BDA99DRAFT_538015 [Phascolomyces articulosus]|uniref:Uncharacterized protein n=1 Tax=Phascolomyces articulosus TaxID=60185 RepID=A0AAD5PDS5_9FUNG|nr:hypothetical protein BDA99DRAFT_538015 [Phascolomyces articulosus]